MKKFKILSIDGGGIRGVYPAHFLELVEAQLANREEGKTQIYQHFDLITGTSTGGIIALALAMGIPANEIHALYKNNVKGIFGKGRNLWGQIWNPKHENHFLEDLLRETFANQNGGTDPRLGDCKTHVCIPIYDLNKGNPSVLKTKYHPNFNRDYHIPIYQVAMATSSAPTYFNPYSSSYTQLDGVEKQFANKVDGGVMANNPTLVALLEATKTFSENLENIEVLSIGTGQRLFNDGGTRKKWSLKYWLISKKRIFDLFMQSQSQLVDNYMSLLHQGIDKTEADNPNFVYDRINVNLTESTAIELDEADLERVKNFAEQASISFQENASKIMERHFY